MSPVCQKKKKDNPIVPKKTSTFEMTSVHFYFKMEG